MNLSVLKSNSKQVALRSYLESKEKALKSVIENEKKADLENLQSELNNIFYENTKFSKDYANSQSNAESAANIEIADNIVDKFKSIDLKNLSAKKDKINQKYMYKTTLQNLVDETQSLVEKLSKIKKITKTEELKNKLNEIKILNKKCKNIIKENYGGLIKIPEDDNNSVVEIYNSLRTFVDTINSQSVKNSNNNIGINFEKALVNAIEQEIDKSANNIIEAVQTGQKSIRRGVDREKKLKSYYYNDNDVEISYDPNVARQGKMDVIIHYNNNSSNQVRISAKRWIGGSGDFGKTNIDAGLIRSIGFEHTDYYKYAVLLNRYKPEFEIGHELAVLALKSDIIMGLNQGKNEDGGMADTLIIDTGSQIIVKSIADIVLNENIGVSYYDKNTIEEEALQNYKKLEQLKKGRSLMYLRYMTSSLHKMEVTVNYSASKNYSKDSNKI